VNHLKGDLFDLSDFYDGLGRIAYAQNRQRGMPEGISCG
jgi:hypothetical protein